MGFNEMLVMQIRTDTMNDVARQFNAAYCQAKQRLTVAKNAGDEYAENEAYEDINFQADAFDAFVIHCKALGIDVTVRLDYESWEC